MHWTNSHSIADPTVCVQTLTQVTAFHLRNKEANRSLKVEWTRTELENSPPPPEVPWCYSWSHAKLQRAHTQYKDEGGQPQQSLKKVVQFEMGSKRKYHKNNSIGIMLFCGWVRSTSLCEIISCPETEPRAKQCIQSRTRCLKPTNVKDLYLLAGIAPPDIRRCMCSCGKDQTGNQWGSLSIWSEPGRGKDKVEELFLAQGEACWLPF